MWKHASLTEVTATAQRTVGQIWLVTGLAMKCASMRIVIGMEMIASAMKIMNAVTLWSMITIATIRNAWLILVTRMEKIAGAHAAVTHSRKEMEPAILNATMQLANMTAGTATATKLVNVFALVSIITFATIQNAWSILVNKMEKIVGALLAVIQSC